MNFGPSSGYHEQHTSGVLSNTSVNVATLELEASAAAVIDVVAQHKHYFEIRNGTIVQSNAY